MHGGEGGIINWEELKIVISVNIQINCQDKLWNYASQFFTRRVTTPTEIREYLIFWEFVLERNIVISPPYIVTRSPMFQENLHIMQVCRLFLLLSQRAIYNFTRALV